VDDEARDTCSLALTLEGAGYSRVQALSDPAALATRLQEEDADLIVLDVDTSGPDGVTALEELRQHVAEDDFLPVIAVGTADSTDYRTRIIRAGAKDYLARPIDIQEFLVRVNSLLEVRFMSRRLHETKALLEELVRRRTRESHDSHMELLDRLARVAELKDDPAGGHPARVGRLSGLIAQELLLPADETRLIMRAAPLHDLGNVAVPDEVLHGEGVYTEEQREQMRQHTSLGAYLLHGAESEVLQTAEQIALSHHERWDGLGYPKGLARMAIPIAARIVAVADAFDAMTHPRAYKEPFSVPQALDEIRRDSGWQFDPEVVAALVRVYERQPGMLTITPRAPRKNAG
jgi:putative two-component system response regulator